ncbi:MAG: B12-binding domain-containing radical SAM protein [Fibrobacter sp.]|nr:B12-binding domain-containing radical SAM protein [Fibrobacter sp.]
MGKPRVLFVEPLGAQSNIFAKFMTIPLLGPLHLSTIAKRDGFDVSIINENLLRRKIDDSELKRADILCLSCITATVNRGHEIAGRYKQIRQNIGAPAKTIIGGIHASMLPEDPGPNFDQVVCGEAESIILPLLEGAFKERIVKGTRLKDLDSIPVPDFTLIKNHSKINILPVMTSRSCPYHCNFCSVTRMFGKEYRTQSVPRVMEELLSYKKGMSIFFVDDNFAAIPSRTHQLLDQMIKSGFRRYWTAQVRTDASRDLEMVKKMKATGCQVVYIGLESINPGSLQKMQKKQSLEDIKRSIRVFQSCGIQVHGMFMLGNDPDSHEIFQSTSSFSLKNHLDFVQYSVLTPLPGTELYDEICSQKRLLHKNWNLFDGLHVVFKPKQMSPAQLQSGMISCFKSFYSYTHAVKDFLFSGTKALKSLRLGQIGPTFYKTVIKLIGRSILNSWIHYNRAYLTYLNNLRE